MRPLLQHAAHINRELTVTNPEEEPPMNQVVVRTEFKRKPSNEDQATKEFQLYCEALQSYPDATSQQPSLTFAKYLRHLQELKVASR